MSDGYTPDVSEVDEGMVTDQWFIDDGGSLVRVHNVPRQRLFVPLRSDETLPVDFNSILPMRHAEMVFADNTVQQHADDWTVRKDEETGPPWTGQTRFSLNHGSLLEAEQPADEAEAPEMESKDVKKTNSKEKPGKKTLHRRRDRTRQLQRGFWREDREEEQLSILRETLEEFDDQGGKDWHRLDEETPLFEQWKALESANAEVSLVLVSKTARRLKKPQPHMGALEVPLRKSYILLADRFLCTDWEQWTQMSPSAQIRPLIAKDRKLYVAVFGKELGAVVQGDEEDDRWRRLEEDPERKFSDTPQGVEACGEAHPWELGACKYGHNVESFAGFQSK